MIGDLICDRKDGQKYSAREFYWGVMNYRDIWPEWADAITRAMDAGTEQDVVAALCNYIKEAGWNGQLCDYISSVKWMEDDPERSFEVKVTFPKDRLMDEQGRTEKQPFTFSTWVDFDVLTGDTEDEASYKLFSQLWTLAARMGWELWLPLTIEIPGHDFCMTMGPKDEQRARQIQRMLERAKRDGKPFHGELEISPKDYKVTTKQEPAL